MDNELHPDEWEKDIDKTEEFGEEEYSSISYEILNYPADTTLRGYLDQHENGLIRVPPFQRRFVWDQVKASKLIESFLIGLPVPGVFLFKERTKSGHLIIDGQQRITSIISYQKGLFDDKAFRLKGVASKWEGRSFSELTDDDRFKIETAVMRSTIIQQIDPLDNSSIYQIFERLNTGGVNLNPMEIRKCVSYGPFIKELEEVNKNKYWRTCIAKQKTDKRLRDVELVLRCLAIYEKQDSYEKPMKQFLNKFSNEMKDNSERSLDLCKNFASACKIIVENLGDKPFNLRGRLNYGVLDSLIVAIMRAPDSRNIKEKYEQLKNDEKYIQSVTYNTSDVSELHQRINMASSILEE